MVVFALRIISKDGGLIYNKEFVKTQAVDLRLESSFHVMYAMAATISPVPASSGIQVFMAEAFKMQCFQAVTGVKFYFVTDPNHSATHLKTLLHGSYELYADYVLKNPFYSLEQPIRCDKFDTNIENLPLTE